MLTLLVVCRDITHYIPSSKIAGWDRMMILIGCYDCLNFAYSIHMAEKLKSSKYGTADSLDHITKRFDETTKRLFRDAKELQYVQFGSPLDKDMTVGIRGGQLKLTG